MTLDQLSAFVATVEHKGFKPAARELGKHASTISTLVMNLEDMLGLELFIRQPRSLSITPEGEELYLEAKAVLREAEMFSNKADSLLQGVKGKLCIAADNSVNHPGFTRLVAALSQQYPGVKIRLLTGDTLQVRSLVLSGQADIGLLLATHTNLAGLDVQRASSFEISVIAPPEWETDRFRSLADLRGEVQVCYSFFTQLGMEEAHVVSHRTLECNDGRQIIDLVAQGAGFAVVPAYLVKEALDTGRVQSIELEEEKPAMWFINLIKLVDTVLDPVASQIYRDIGRLADPRGRA